MAIITISRELAALGDETAQELARLLKYRLVNKQSLEDRMKSYGLTDRKLEKYDERKPSFWASLSQDRDDYLHYLKTALLAEAGDGNCIVIGRGAAAVFKDVPAVVAVFLTAPPDIRAERVKSYFHCGEKRARQILEQSDYDRTGFHHYFFDMEWKAPSNYSLILNTKTLHPAVCAQTIKFLLDSTVGEETEAEGLKRLRELSLGLQVVHHIIYERTLPVHFLEAVISNEGGAALYGVANSQGLAEAALHAAREVPGVQTARSEIQVVQEYNITPQGGVMP
jgi:cytidylate kinase